MKSPIRKAEPAFLVKEISSVRSNPPKPAKSLRFHPSHRWLVLFAMILACFKQDLLAGESSMPESLFEDSPNSSHQKSGELLQQPGQERVRLGRFAGKGLFGDLATRLQAGTSFRLNLFEDKSFTAVLHRIEPIAGGGWTARGGLEGHPEGQVLLSGRAGVVSGTVFSPGDGRYAFFGRTGGDVRISQLALESPRCATCEIPSSEQRSRIGSSLARQGLAPVLDPVTNVVQIVDLLVVHTAAARAGAGGPDEIRSLASLAVAEANSVYQNSRANVRLRLIHQQEVDYVESTSFSTNLLRLRMTNDGFLDEVHAIRETNKADLVCLITEAGDTGFGGLASLMQEAKPESRSFGFSVVRRKDAVGSFVLAHEVTHNFGCQHDRENASGSDGILVPGVFHYSFGHRFIAEGKTYRTVMAYPPGEVVPFLSTPNILYLGTPIGISDTQTNSAADNVKTVNATAPIVSAYAAPALQTTVPSLLWVEPVAGAVVAAGQTVTVKVRASDPDGSIRQVELYDSGRFLKAVVSPGSPEVVIAIPDLEPGPHFFSARAVDNLGAESSLVERVLTVRPQNDAFASRIQIPGATFTLRGSTAGATREPGEPLHADNQGAGSVWYAWTAEQSGTVTLVSTGNKYLGMVGVYQGTSLSTLVPVHRSIRFDSAKRTCTVQADVTAGQTLLVAADSLPGYGEAFEMVLSYQQAPPNDGFNSRLPVLGESFQLEGTNNFATVEPGEPKHASSVGGKSVWYEWVAPKAGAVLLTCTGTNVAWLVDAYTGSRVDSLSPVPARFTSYDPARGVSTLGFNATAGRSYAIAVDGAGGKSGVFQLQLAYPAPPANDHFVDRRILNGTNITFVDNNSSASSESGEPGHAGTTAAKSLWYSWVAPVTGPVKIVMAGTGFSVVPDAYQGSVLASLKVVNRGIKVVPGSPSELTFQAVLGERYEIAVDGFGGRGGEFRFTLETANQPAQLLGRTAALSQTVNEFRFQIGGSLGQRYAIELSEDLVNWTPLKSGTIGSEPEIYQESIPNRTTARFYRVFPLP